MNPSPDYGGTIPHLAFMVFQCMFAIITAALITGAFAERMKFGAFLLFTLLWTTFVYNPLAHWVWGDGGWMGRMGALDFAGGTVVHISSGISALAAALVVGVPLGILLGSRRFVGRNALIGLVNSGMGVPPVVVGLGLALLLWRSGPLGSLQLMYTHAGPIDSRRDRMASRIAPVPGEPVRARRETANDQCAQPAPSGIVDVQLRHAPSRHVELQGRALRRRVGKCRVES